RRGRRDDRPAVHSRPRVDAWPRVGARSCVEPGAAVAVRASVTDLTSPTCGEEGEQGNQRRKNTRASHSSSIPTRRAQSEPNVQRDQGGFRGGGGKLVATRRASRSCCQRSTTR